LNRELLPKRNLILPFLFIWKKTKFISNAKFIETFEAIGLKDLLSASLCVAVDIMR